MRENKNIFFKIFIISKFFLISVEYLAFYSNTVNIFVKFFCFWHLLRMCFFSKIKVKCSFLPISYIVYKISNDIQLSWTNYTSLQKKRFVTNFYETHYEYVFLEMAWSDIFCHISQKNFGQEWAFLGLLNYLYLYFFYKLFFNHTESIYTTSIFF